MSVPTLSVKNFETFQHYKDRKPPWIKLYHTTLEDYEFGQLPDTTKWHLVAIWLLASRTNNKIPHDAEWISQRIQATEKVDLSPLIKAGFLIENQPLHSTQHNASVVIATCPPEKETETDKDSVPNGTGANAPDWKAILFDESLNFLSEHYGKPRDKYRSLLGKWRMTLDDNCEALVELIREAEVNREADPVAWITAATQTRTGQREPKWKRDKIREAEEFQNA